MDVRTIVLVAIGFVATVLLVLLLVWFVFRFRRKRRVEKPLIPEGREPPVFKVLVEVEDPSILTDQKRLDQILAGKLRGQYFISATPEVAPSSTPERSTWIHLFILTKAIDFGPFVEALKSIEGILMVRKSGDWDVADDEAEEETEQKKKKRGWKLSPEALFSLAIGTLIAIVFNRRLGVGPLGSIIIGLAVAAVAYYYLVLAIRKLGMKGNIIGFCPTNKSIAVEVYDNCVKIVVAPSPTLVAKVKLMVALIEDRIPCTILWPGLPGIFIVGLHPAKNKIKGWVLEEADLGDETKAKHSLSLAFYRKIFEPGPNGIPVVHSADNIPTRVWVLVIFTVEDLMTPLYDVTYPMDVIRGILASAVRDAISGLSYSDLIVNILGTKLGTAKTTEAVNADAIVSNILKGIKSEMLAEIQNRLRISFGAEELRTEDGKTEKVVLKPVCRDVYQENAKSPRLRKLYANAYPGIEVELCLKEGTPAYTIRQKVGGSVQVFVMDVEDEAGIMTYIQNIVKAYVDLNKKVVEAEAEKLADIERAEGKRISGRLRIQTYEPDKDKAILEPDKYAPSKEASQLFALIEGFGVIQGVTPGSKLIMLENFLSLGGGKSALREIVEAATAGSAAVDTKSLSPVKEERPASEEAGPQKEES
jgi:F0F1-type ATP synthase assembly protein I